MRNSKSLKGFQQEMLWCDPGYPMDKVMAWEKQVHGIPSCLFSHACSMSYRLVIPRKLFLMVLIQASLCFNNSQIPRAHSWVFLIIVAVRMLLQVRLKHNFYTGRKIQTSLSNPGFQIILFFVSLTPVWAMLRWQTLFYSWKLRSICLNIYFFTQGFCINYTSGV